MESKGAWAGQPGYEDEADKTQTQDLGVGAMTIIFDLDGTLSYRG